MGRQTIGGTTDASHARPGSERVRHVPPRLLLTNHHYEVVTELVANWWPIAIGTLPHSCRPDRKRKKRQHLLGVSVS